MIVFKNKGLLDLDLLRIMGAHVKENDNPIGRFGTGLKFAIATLLRNKIDFYLMLGDARFDFFTEPKTLRGKEFDIVRMQGPYDSVDFNITTELGRDWQLWQAYRELYANCLDEGGSVDRDCTSVPVDAESTVFVLPSDIDVGECVLADTDKPLLYKDDEIEIHEGESECLYYKGFRASNLSKPSLYTYNILRTCSLSEDRMLAYSFEYNAVIMNAVTSMGDESIINSIIQSPKDRYESSLSFGDWRALEPKEKFIERFKEAIRPNPTIAPYIRRWTPPAPKTREERRADFLGNIEALCDEYSVDFQHDESTEVVSIDIKGLE